MDLEEKIGKKYVFCVWCFVCAVIFAAALFGSAWTGISLAKKNLPDWVGEESEVLRGDELVIGGDEQMIYLAEENQRIKDFFNRYTTVDERLQADVDEASVRRLSAEVKVRVKRRDASTVSVEVLSGPLNGEAFWMPVSQLSLRKKIEDLPLIKDDK